jgi:hypothetical protein
MVTADPTGIMLFLASMAELGSAPAGLVGAFEPEPGTAELVSMWVLTAVKP